MSQARTRGSHPDSISKYFDMLEDTLRENGILDKPCQLFNTDELGMPLNPKPLQTWAKEPTIDGLNMLYRYIKN